MNSLFVDFFKEFWRGILGGVRDYLGVVLVILGVPEIVPNTSKNTPTNFLNKSPNRLFIDPGVHNEKAIKGVNMF